MVPIRRKTFSIALTVLVVLAVGTSSLRAEDQEAPPKAEPTPAAEPEGTPSGLPALTPVEKTTPEQGLVMWNEILDLHEELQEAANAEPPTEDGLVVIATNGDALVVKVSELYRSEPFPSRAENIRLKRAARHSQEALKRLVTLARLLRPLDVKRQSQRVAGAMQSMYLAFPSELSARKVTHQPTQ